MAVSEVVTLLEMAMEASVEEAVEDGVVLEEGEVIQEEGPLLTIFSLQPEAVDRGIAARTK